MKKIIIAFVLILSIGSVSADISSKIIVKSSQSIEDAIVVNANENINFLPSSHVYNKPLGQKITNSSICTSACYRAFRNCIVVIGPVYQCFDRYGDCRANCGGGGL